MMYKFNLEPVLKHRKLIEEDLQKDFAVLNRQLLNEKEQLFRLEQVRDRFSRELQQQQTKNVRVSDMLLYSEFIQHVTREIEMQFERILETEKAVEKKRVALIDAMKSRKSIDRLKEKGLKSHLQKLAEKEQKLTNEAAIQIFNRAK